MEVSFSDYFLLDEGVNTGVGGSAGARTGKVPAFQQIILEQLHYGVLTVPEDDQGEIPERAPKEYPLLNESSVAASVMPLAWVRASMLIRANSLASGYSGVSPGLVDRLLEFLDKDIIPFVPLRGSISASGDLSPLSYIASALEGHPRLHVSMPGKGPNSRRSLTAKAALQELAIEPITLGPKDGIAMVNGTAVCAGVGALALHDAHHLAILSQVLTSMTMEALRGFPESLDPFIAAVRPHPGQIEASRNIRGFISGSRLLRGNDAVIDEGTLPQDRYPLRTASQWIGPQLENLVLAHKQLLIECNSTTDNPLINTGGGKILNGGNFQAMSVTSAMEKVRLSIQALGRLSFAQCAELFNVTLNNGLPPNLAPGEPSRSSPLKGFDIGNTSLVSELGFLANPVVTHVQSAELNNQSVNSLALISARYTHTALNVLSQLLAGHLLCVCQALDLRAIEVQFLSAVEPELRKITENVLGPFFKHPEPNTECAQKEVHSIHGILWDQFQKELNSTVTMDSDTRFYHISSSLQRIILQQYSSAHHPSSDQQNIVQALSAWVTQSADKVSAIFRYTLESYTANPDPAAVLSKTASRVYKFVRQELGVGFADKEWNPWEQESKAQTVGDMVTTVHGALRDGRLCNVIIECLQEVDANESLV